MKSQQWINLLKVIRKTALYTFNALKHVTPHVQNYQDESKNLQSELNRLTFSQMPTDIVEDHRALKVTKLYDQHKPTDILEQESVLVDFKLKAIKCDPSLDSANIPLNEQNLEKVEEIVQLCMQKQAKLLHSSLSAYEIKKRSIQDLKPDELNIIVQAAALAINKINRAIDQLSAQGKAESIFSILKQFSSTEVWLYHMLTKNVQEALRVHEGQHS